VSERKLKTGRTRRAMVGYTTPIDLKESILLAGSSSYEAKFMSCTALNVTTNTL
jgi:hypothetical protein